MPVFRLTENPTLFPDPEQADPSGLLAVGGDLRPARLLAAYAQGIFPRYSQGQPILWHSPDPRFVLEPTTLHVPKSLRKTLRRQTYVISLDTAFSQVISSCARIRRPHQQGTWITPAMEQAYNQLHRLGYAHSVEAWDNGRLLGGLYGVSLGRAFFGESMFALAPDASKAAFVALVEQLAAWGFRLVDCQQETAHLARFGAKPWPRHRFLEVLHAAVSEEGRHGPWRFDIPR